MHTLPQVKVMERLGCQVFIMASYIEPVKEREIEQIATKMADGFTKSQDIAKKVSCTIVNT